MSYAAPITLLGLGTLVLLGGLRQPREAKGQSMVVVLRLPSGLTEEQLRQLMPEDSAIQLDGDRAVVTFTAPRDAVIADFETPLGIVRVESARRLSDVVSGMIPGPTYYTFSWWEKRPGIGMVFSGWTRPKVLEWRQANSALARQGMNQYAVRALMWDGSRWVNPP